MEQDEIASISQVPESTEPAETAPEPAKPEKPQPILAKNNKRKRSFATKSSRRKPPPFAAPPSKKQRTDNNFAPPDLTDALPAMSAWNGGILQGGVGLGGSSSNLQGAVGLGVSSSNLHYTGLDDNPFTEEEMNEPLPTPPDMGDPQYSNNNPFVFDQGFDVGDSGVGQWEGPGGDAEYYEPQQPPKKPRQKKKRNKTVRNSSTVSLSALLENTDGVDPQYAKERKTFYAELEEFLKRPPDVNLLCGAPVDLYQLYTETFNRGGYEAVCQSKQWRQIFRQLPQYSSTHTSASYALKKMYRKNLSAYEEHQRNGGAAAGF